MLYFRMYKRMQKWVRGLGPSEIGLAAPDIIFFLVIPVAFAGIIGSILENFWNASQVAWLLFTVLIVAAAVIYVRICSKADKD